MAEPSVDAPLKTGECASCGTRLEGPFCHRCGQPTISQRFTTPKLLAQLASYLSDVESGFLHTARCLLRRPGGVVQDYWRGRTVEYYAPFRYFFIWTAVLLLTNFWLGVDDVMQSVLQPKDLEDRAGASTVIAADRQFDQWLKLLVLAQVPINSLSSWILFRRHGRTYGEHLILNSYVMGQLALLSIGFQLLVVVSVSLVYPFLMLSFLLGVVFYTVTLRYLFQESTGKTVAKAVVQAVVGLVAYGALVAGAASLALALNS